MLRLIVSRLLQLPVILAVIFVVTFVLAWVIPGNPLDRSPDRRPPKAVQEAMLRQYNLDNPWTFATSYLKGIFLHGDLGPSLYYPDRRVDEVLAEGLPVSAALGVAALVLALIIGLAAGGIGALKPRSTWDFSSLLVALAGVSLPTFVTASVLLAVFAGLLSWVPIGGWDWPGWAVWTGAWWSGAGAMIGRMILPALALSLLPAAYIARLIRLGLAEVMSSDYIRTARAKGLSPRQVLMRHAMKVAFLPVLSFLGPAAASALTGSFVVEQVFSIPGVGRDFVAAVLNKDQFLILGLVLVYSTMLILFNLMVDLAYAWVDPRIEL